MSNSLAMLGAGAENLSIDGWREHFNLDSGIRRGRRQYLRDPLMDAWFRGARIKSVFGYFSPGETGDPSLVYFWCGSLHRAQLRGLNESWSAEYLRLAQSLMQSIDERPDIERIKSILGGKFEKDCPKIYSELSSLNTTWMEWDEQYSQYRFGCLFEYDVGDGCISATMDGVLDALAFHFDYFRLNSLMWGAIPMGYLANVTRGDSPSLQRLHLHPKCFNPEKPEREELFLWPWQRSLKFTDKIEHQPIKTTSLVFDIRKSTIALEKLRSDRIGLFSDFIKEIVAAAKQAILDHGGFFDKETGDGVVGHFVEFDDLKNGDRCVLPGKRAFDASVQMIRSASQICQEFQEHVHFEIEPLGGAVGLHSDEAVWLAENGAVHAIGESVIQAARLANEAKPRCIFMSKSQLVDLKEHLSADQLLLFEKQGYQGKEARDDAGLLGYTVAVSDNF